MYIRDNRVKLAKHVDCYFNSNYMNASLFQCIFASFICQLVILGIFAKIDPGRMVLFSDAPG